jgi:uncharacterized protein (DUF1684 family)
VSSAAHAIDGDTERAKELIKNAGKASLSAGVTLAATGLTVATGGAAAPLGTAASVGVGAGMGASTSVVSTGVDSLLYNDGEVDEGALVGGTLLGGAAGKNVQVVVI